MSTELKNTTAITPPAPRCVLFATTLAPKGIPVPSDFPAALLPLGWSTWIERVLDQLATLGVRTVDVVVSTRPEDVRRRLGQGERWGMRLHWHLAKDASTPYGVLQTLDWQGAQRVLVGHADRLLDSAVLSNLLARDHMVVMAPDQGDVAWVGWGSVALAHLPTAPIHCTEQTLGQQLCGQAAIALIDVQACCCADSASALLAAQQSSLDAQGIDKVPATWLRRPWGAHSPDAIIQPGAVMEGPALVGPGCLVSSGAKIGAGTVLTHDVLISQDASVCNSVVFPQTFVGQGLELDHTLVNGRSVEHLRLGVRTVLPVSDGLLLNLQAKKTARVAWFSRVLAALLCGLLAPWLGMDTLLRRVRGLPLRWRKREVVLGRDLDTDNLRLQFLRCAVHSSAGATHPLAHYGAWMDVVGGRRSWFGSRPRSPSEWYALGRDWQLLLSASPVGCLHASAWSEEGGDNLEAYAAADVFFAVSQTTALRLRIVLSLLKAAIPGFKRPQAPS